MKNLTNNPKLSKYLETYNQGQPLFLEGDTSKDLYILVHGSLKLLKNKKQIGEIYKAGDMIGEMSYLLESKRTASVISQTEVRVLRIPENEIQDFINDFPEASQRIIHTMAQRLKDTTQVAHGLREFCDQLPDAVVMTDTSNKIMAWNKAAESLHGRVWQEMKGQSISDVFQNPEEYRQFIEDVQAGRHLREKVLLIRHPDGEMLYVSTSTTVIYDGHFNIAGYIFLSRNVTTLKRLEKRYQHIKKLFIPAFAIIAILLVIIFAGVSNFSDGVRILDHKKKSFQSRIIHDRRNLTEALIPLISTTDREGITNTFDQYFQKTHPGQFAISGILLLDKSKKVINAYSQKSADNLQSLIGSNYSGIKFIGANDSACKVLNIYRATKEAPMGYKCTELALPINDSKGNIENWIIFQLEIDYLNTEFGINNKTLFKMKFDPKEVPTNPS